MQTLIDFHAQRQSSFVAGLEMHPVPGLVLIM